jgi:hypothetical protein
MKLGFWFDYDQTYSFVALYKELARRGVATGASGFLINDRYALHAEVGLPEGSRLIRLYDLVNEARGFRPTAAELAEFKALDLRLKLARMAYSDRHLATWAHDDLVPLYIHLLKAFRRYIAEARPDAFIFNCIASQYAHLFAAVLEEARVPMVVPMHYGVENLVYLCDGPYQLCEDVWATYRDYQTGRGAPDAATVTWAEAFMARVREMKPAYSNFAVAAEERKLRLPGPRRALRYLGNYFRYYRNDPTLPSIPKRLADLFRARSNRRRNLAMFQPFEAIGQADYIYYPLHLEPEIATLIITQYDQRSIIDIVVRQLPLAWKLVIKDHPAQIGQRDPAFFRELGSRYPNIVFVDPGVSSQLLARRARATLTLSGTVTLEALILGTPAIFAHPSRFGGFELGTLTQDFVNFGRVLDAALARRHTDRDLVNMLAAIRRHCHEFIFVEPLGHPTMLGEANIAKMADGIGGHLIGRRASSAA